MINLNELFMEIPSQLKITERQRKAIDKLDISNRRSVINMLMKQQGLGDDDNQTTNIDDLVQEHDRVMSSIREMRNPYLDTTDTTGSYKIAENDISTTKSDASSSVSSSDDKSLPNNLANMDKKDLDFMRVLKRTFNEEGGYEDNPQKIEIATNMGIRQDTLDRFIKKHPDLAIGFPSLVKNLSEDQIAKIYRVDFFDYYRIGEINNKQLQDTLFDTFVNHSPKAVGIWIQTAINSNSKQKVDVDGVFGSKTIKALNNLTDEEVKNVNNSFIDLRDDDRKERAKKDSKYDKRTKGIPKRTKGFRI